MKILECNSVVQNVFSGIITNYLLSNEMVGVAPGVLNECSSIKVSSSSINVEKGLIFISGVRVFIDEPYTLTIPNFPATNMDYQLIVRITILESGDNSVAIMYRPKEELRIDNFLLTNSGIYEFELASFILGATGISTFTNTAKKIEIPMFKTITQEEYDALVVKSENTYYFIVEK